MDTKSKSKWIHLVLTAAALYLIGIFLLSAFDFISHRRYLIKDPYLNSTSFSEELRSYSESVGTLYGNYNNYDKKTIDEKVTDEEALQWKETIDSNLKRDLDDTERGYKSQIYSAEQAHDSEKSKKLTEEMNAKLDEMKKENNKTVQDVKKDIAKIRDEDYERVKKAVESRNDIKYYLVNSKNSETHANIENVQDIKEYIKNEALFALKCPNQEQTGKSCRNINICLPSGYEGYFIIPKYHGTQDQMHQNMAYYDSIRRRVLIEGALGALSLAAGMILLKKNAQKNCEEFSEINDLAQLYHRIPLDVKAFLFIMLFFIMIDYMTSTQFFYFPAGIEHVGKLSLVAIYVLYLILSLSEARHFAKNKDQIKEQWKKSLLHKLSLTMKDSFLVKNTAFKFIMFVIVTIVAALVAVMLLLQHSTMVSLAVFACAFIYIVIVFTYVFSKIGYLNRIIKGTEEMASGNLNHTVEEKGSGALSQLARNINNMKNGMKNAVDSQMKSERMKTELITNVSHDLKTPLTSIINYVEILKDKELAKDEHDSYIEILDRKSQRLKVLIEDLFEASKMSSGAVELNLERVDVVELLHQTLGEYNEKISSSSLDFKVNIPNKNIFLNLDGKRTFRVFENLLSNIIKYSQPSTRVYIDLKEENHKVVITMRNISAYELNFDVEEIFERFKRGDASRNTEGSGLGLAIAKSIVELQGGTLDIEIDGDLFKAIIIFNI